MALNRASSGIVKVAYLQIMMYVALLAFVDGVNAKTMISMASASYLVCYSSPVKDNAGTLDATIWLVPVHMSQSHWIPKWT